MERNYVTVTLCISGTLSNTLDLDNFRIGTSIVATCCQLISTNMYVQCKKLATVVGRIKLKILATVDIRPTTLDSFQHWASIFAYGTIRIRQRVVRVYPQQLIFVPFLPDVTSSVKYSVRSSSAIVCWRRQCVILNWNTTQFFISPECVKNSGPCFKAL